MTWNYRIVRRTLEDGDVLYAIHEVYYDDGGAPTLVTEEPSCPMGEGFEELRDDLNNYNLAMLDPVLNYEDIGGSSSGNDYQTGEGEMEHMTMEWTDYNQKHVIERLDLEGWRPLLVVHDTVILERENN